MPKLEENKIYRAYITGYASDGSGVARVEGMAVFVKNAIRDELADILIEHVGHNAAWGRVVKLLQACPARRLPDCPHYDLCGGCQFRHMNYPEELEAKRTRVEDALRRIGGVDLAVSIISGARNTERYRNKVQMPVSDQAIGYYKARTHQVVDVEDCPLQPHRASKCRRAVEEWMRVYQVPAYREKEHRGLVRHLYLRFNQAGETLCCLVINGKSVPHGNELVRLLRQSDPGLIGVVLNLNTKRTNVILGEQNRTLWGQDWLEENLHGLTFRLSVSSFFQINREQTEVLYKKVLDLAGLTGTETVLDLYCGIGTISLCLASGAKRVIGAEMVSHAIEDAKANAARNNIANADFFQGDAGEVAQRLSAQGVKPDVICVDPPRKGLAPEIPAVLAGMGPSRIVYVSCNPATLARDVKRLRDLGYVPTYAEAIDLFPKTAHVETVVCLSRQKPDDVIRVGLDLDELEVTPAESKATYGEIKAYVWENFGLKVSSLYISQVKRKCGLDVGEHYNLSKSENAKQPQCPLEKEKAIMAALKHFQMIEGGTHK